MIDVWHADEAAAAVLVGIGGGSIVLSLFRGATLSDRVKRESGTLFLPPRVMQAGYVLCYPFIRLALACGLAPNAVTWASLVPGAASGVLVACGLPGLAACCLAISGLCDLVDGAVARATGRTTASGAALDSTLDRYVEFFFLAGALCWFSGVVVWQLLVMVAQLGSFMVTYSTAKAEALRVTPPRGWMKRAERMVVLIVGASAAGLAPWWGGRGAPWLAGAIAVVAVLANVSAVMRLAALQRTVTGDRR